MISPKIHNIHFCDNYWKFSNIAIFALERPLSPWSAASRYRRYLCGLRNRRILSNSALNSICWFSLDIGVPSGVGRFPKIGTFDGISDSYISTVSDAWITHHYLSKIGTPWCSVGITYFLITFSNRAVWISSTGYYISITAYLPATRFPTRNV